MAHGHSIAGRFRTRRAGATARIRRPAATNDNEFHNLVIEAGLGRDAVEVAAVASVTALLFERGTTVIPLAIVKSCAGETETIIDPAVSEESDPQEHYNWLLVRLREMAKQREIIALAMLRRVQIQPPGEEQERPAIAIHVEEEGAAKAVVTWIPVRKGKLVNADEFGKTRKRLIFQGN